MATCLCPEALLFKEIDDRPGYYVGAHLSYLNRVELRYLHYEIARTRKCSTRASTTSHG